MAAFPMTTSAETFVVALFRVGRGGLQPMSQFRFHGRDQSLNSTHSGLYKQPAASYKAAPSGG